MYLKSDRNSIVFFFNEEFAHCNDWTDLLILWPLTLKFDRATRPFLKFDRRHWTLLKSRERNEKIVTRDSDFS